MRATTPPSILLTLLLAACGGEQAEVPADADPAGAEPPVAAAAEATPDPVSVGTMTLTVASEPKRFDHLPEDENFYLRLTSTVHAQPEPGSTEQLRIVFVSVDLADQAYPVQLPQPIDSAQEGIAAARTGSIGFSYTDPTGSEWAGPGRVRIDSFSDGVLRGTFGEVTLPHTDDERPDLTLSEGSFSARIASSG